ncbi:MAG: hypothetical protein A3K10_14840, partial [Bacteroidetes bacterium RIFCSPLOWO2_12_FULL_31_6]
TPYIVKSRTSSKLKTNLLKNNFPILFEGLHSCFLLDDIVFKNRIKIFRSHNIEHNYYNHLALAEKNIKKRQYYQSEAKKLLRFEPIIKNATVSLVVSLKDLVYFKNKYPKSQFEFVPCFHAGEEVTVKSGIGNYVLYHGNLSVSENKNAAEFIIQQLFKELTIPLIIAGLNPPADLIQLIKKYDHIRLIANPDDKEMNELIANAQINLLYTNQATGLKLKLLNVLYNGRHCIVNSKMVEGTSLSELCGVEDDISQLKKLITTTFNNEISTQEIEKRKTVLLRDYSNESSYQKIIKALQSF